jgi:hypothetical protein
MNETASPRPSIAAELTSPPFSIVAFLAAACLAVATPAHALGDNCKDVRISVFNDHPVEVKVTRIEYRDFDRDNKWRSEAFIDRRAGSGRSGRSEHRVA